MSEPTNLRRKFTPNRFIEKWPTSYELMMRGIIEFAGIQGDPDEFGSDAYNFFDKPHRFIRDLIKERAQMTKDYTQTLAAIQIIAEGGTPPNVPDSRAYDAVVAMRDRLQREERS